MTPSPPWRWIVVLSVMVACTPDLPTPTSASESRSGEAPRVVNDDVTSLADAGDGSNDMPSLPPPPMWQVQTYDLPPVARDATFQAYAVPWVSPGDATLGIVFLDSEPTLGQLVVAEVDSDGWANKIYDLNDVPNELLPMHSVDVAWSVTGDNGANLEIFHLTSSHPPDTTCPLFGRIERRRFEVNSNQLQPNTTMGPDPAAVCAGLATTNVDVATQVNRVVSTAVALNDTTPILRSWVTRFGSVVVGSTVEWPVDWQTGRDRYDFSAFATALSGNTLMTYPRVESFAGWRLEQATVDLEDNSRPVAFATRETTAPPQVAAAANAHTVMTATCANGDLHLIAQRDGETTVEQSLRDTLNLTLGLPPDTPITCQGLSLTPDTNTWLLTWTDPQGLMVAVLEPTGTAPLPLAPTSQSIRLVEALPEDALLWPRLAASPNGTLLVTWVIDRRGAPQLNRAVARVER